MCYHTSGIVHAKHQMHQKHRHAKHQTTLSTLFMQYKSVEFPHRPTVGHFSNFAFCWANAVHKSELYHEYIMNKAG